MAQDTFIKADKISSDSGNLSTDGSGNVTANTLTATSGGNGAVLIKSHGSLQLSNTGNSASAQIQSGGVSDVFYSTPGTSQSHWFQDNSGNKHWVMGVGGKLGIAGNNDVFDYSAAQALRKLGPNSTTLKDVIAATTNNWTDNNANQINSCSKITGSTNTAVNHNYAGTLTPTIITTMLGTAGTVIWGTIGTTQGTITMSAAGAYVAMAQLI